MTDIEQDARTAAEREYPDRPGDRTGAGWRALARSIFEKGYITGASRPASPATRETVTEEMVERAARVLMRDYEAEYDAEHLTWRDFADVARAALEAALTETRDNAARPTGTLKLLDEVIAGAGEETHYGECWRRHAGCLAARMRGMLTGEGA